MSSDILLQAQGLERRYGERLALAGLDLTLARGEILGLLGPNGAGKSTTLRILSGTLPPSAGTVRLGGVDLLARPLAAKRRLGYLPEVPPVYADMRVADYLTYCGRLHGLKRQRLLAAVTRAIERCQLGEVRHRVIGNLSKGYQQRVGLAQAILHKPDVLILDEPTVGLDPLQMREIRQLMQQLRAGRAIVFSSHILPEIQALCDRVVILRDGQPVYNGAVSASGGAGVQQVRLRCRQRPEPERLRTIAGVLEAQAAADGSLRLSLADDAAAERVQRAVLEAGWGLQEWMPAETGLERLFLSLVHGEQEDACR